MNKEKKNEKCQARTSNKKYGEKKCPDIRVENALTYSALPKKVFKKSKCIKWGWEKGGRLIFPGFAAARKVRQLKLAPVVGTVK